MISSNIKQFLANNKKIFHYIALFFVISLFSIDFTFAAAQEVKIVDKASGIVDAINGLLKGVTLLLGLMTYLATLFLSPEWINGSLFGMNEKFKEVWIMVSNIVYFVFAFILIWIAFMNIIGKNADQYQLKQALPKFIVGVLIVPFSWFLVQFILSISAILTVSALTLPIDSFNDYKTKLELVNVPSQCEINLKSLGETKETEGNGDFIDCSKGEKVPLTDLVNGNANSTSSIYGVISMYTYGIIGFDNVDNINKADTGSITKLGDVLVKVIFDFLFVLVYAILIIALGMVLMIRGIYIWIYTMMSPIFGLMYFFDKKDGGGDGFFAKFNIKEFISLAMVPVYTMLALSFGLLFMYVVGSGLAGTNPTSVVAKQSIEVKSETDGGKIIIGGKDKNIELTIKGAVSSQSMDSSGFIKAIGGGALGVVGALILKLFGIVVLWGTVMAAMRSSDVTKAIVEPLHQFGTKVGGIVTSAPGNIPVFGGQSMSSMSTAAGTVSSAITTAQNKRGTDLGQKFAGGSEKTKEYNKLWATVSGDRDTALKNTKKVLSTGGIDELSSNQAGIKALVKQLTALANKEGFKEKDTALKYIKEIETKGLGNKAVLSDNLSKLDLAAKVSSMSILGGSKEVLANDVKDYLGKSYVDEKNTGSSIKTREVDTGNAIHIEVGGISNKIDRDSNMKTTNDVDRGELLKQVIRALNEGINADEVKDKILDKFSDSEEVLKKGLYYNKESKLYGSNKVDGYEKVDGIIETE